MSASDDIHERFRPLFEPRTVAVVGASADGGGPGNNFLRHLRAYGFEGSIYPIHPSAAEIDGLKAYRSLGETPEPVDYAYVTVSAARVPSVLDAARGRVRFAQVMSGGFAEHAEGRELQEELVAAAHRAGVRLLGPNCMGTHSPRGRLTFVADPAPASGTVGVLAQSGGLSIDILRRGKLRGVGFSALVTLGNSADLGPCDLLEYLLADRSTRCIGLYLESVADGRRMFELLRKARGAKPVVLLKGGRTRQGERASASHTGALASDDRIWTGFARQAGVSMVETLDEFLDALVLFQSLTPNPSRPTRRVALFGNGGGTSVLAADCFGLRGFEVEPFPPSVQRALEALRLPPGSSVANPIDVPANALRAGGDNMAARILEAVVAHDPPDAVVVHANLPVLLDYKNVDLARNLIDAVLAARARQAGATHFVLVLRSDGDLAIEARRQAYRAQALTSAIPCYAELVDAARALIALRGYESYLGRVACA